MHVVCGACLARRNGAYVGLGVFRLCELSLCEEKFWVAVLRLRASGVSEVIVVDLICSSLIILVFGLKWKMLFMIKR